VEGAAALQETGQFLQVVKTSAQRRPAWKSSFQLKIKNTGAHGDASRSKEISNFYPTYLLLEGFWRGKPATQFVSSGAECNPQPPTIPPVSIGSTFGFWVNSIPSLAAMNLFRTPSGLRQSILISSHAYCFTLKPYNIRRPATGRAARTNDRIKAKFGPAYEEGFVGSDNRHYQPSCRPLCLRRLCCFRPAREEMGSQAAPKSEPSLLSGRDFGHRRFGRRTRHLLERSGQRRGGVTRQRQVRRNLYASEDEGRCRNRDNKSDHLRSAEPEHQRGCRKRQRKVRRAPPAPLLDAQQDRN
jgi:hypothetical protein